MSHARSASCSPKDMDWDNIGFGLTPTTSMFLATCSVDGQVRARRLLLFLPLSPRPFRLSLLLSLLGRQWGAGTIRPYGNLELSPSAAVLNYGQGVFEGMKAYRTAKGRVVRAFSPLAPVIFHSLLHAAAWARCPPLTAHYCASDPSAPAFRSSSAPTRTPRAWLRGPPACRCPRRPRSSSSTP